MMKIPRMNPAIAAVIKARMKKRPRENHLRLIGPIYDLKTLLSFVIWHACGWRYLYYQMTFIDGVSVISYPIWRSWRDYLMTLWSDWIQPWQACLQQYHVIQRLFLGSILTSVPLPIIATYNSQKPMCHYWSIDSWHNFIYQVRQTCIHLDWILILDEIEQLYFGAERLYKRLNTFYATRGYKRMPLDDVQAMVCTVILVKLCYRLDDKAL